MHPLLENFAAGLRIGTGLRNLSNERKAGQAWSNVLTRGADKGQPAIQGPALAPGEEVEELFTDAEVADQPTSQGTLPSSRDWTTFTEQVYRAEAPKGSEAVMRAHERITKLQQREVLKNLGAARALLAQGRDMEAAPYLERAASFVPDFASLITGPATMRDGSTKLAAAAHDEQTGEPRGPGMIATVKAVDQLMDMFSNPEHIAQNNRAHQLALERLGIQLGNLQLRAAQAKDTSEYRRESLEERKRSGRASRKYMEWQQKRGREAPTKIQTPKDARRAMKETIESVASDPYTRDKLVPPAMREGLYAKMMQEFLKMRQQYGNAPGLDVYYMAETLLRLAQARKRQQEAGSNAVGQ